MGYPCEFVEILAVQSCQNRPLFNFSPIASKTNSQLLSQTVMTPFLCQSDHNMTVLEILLNRRPRNHKA